MVVKPFEVVPMYSTDFFDIQTEADQINCTKNHQISKAVSLTINSTDFSSVTVKETHNNMDIFKKARIFKKGKSVKDRHYFILLPHGIQFQMRN